MNKTELREIIRNHSLWLNVQGGSRANLRDAHLLGSDLSRANLRRADLSRANLRGADLRGADLRGADLHLADLIDADLRGADLRYADLSGAYLLCSNLAEADLTGADLSGVRGGPKYYSISWRDHGVRGRRLHAVEQDGQLVFCCGCFSGSESGLREYIKDGDQAYAASRLRALEIILELHNMASVKEEN